MFHLSVVSKCSSSLSFSSNPLVYIPVVTLRVHVVVIHPYVPRILSSSVTPLVTGHFSLLPLHHIRIIRYPLSCRIHYIHVLCHHVSDDAAALRILHSILCLLLMPPLCLTPSDLSLSRSIYLLMLVLTPTPPPRHPLSLTISHPVRACCPFLRRCAL